MSLKAYIRYDSQGRIVPGGPIVTSTKPANGNWQVVTEGTSVTLSGQLRAFVKLDRYNKPLASTLFLGKERPASGKWLEVNATYAPQNATYYNVAGCERMEYHVIKYTGAGTLTEGTIVNNSTPECWFVVDVATGPEDVGTIQQIWNTAGECQPCINAHTTTTTTTLPVVNSVKMLTVDYTTTAAIYLRDFNQKYYLLNGANGFTVYYTGTLGVGTTLYFNSNLTDPAGVWSNLYLIETVATQGNPYAEPTDRIFTIDSNGTLTSIVSTIAQASYTQWQVDKRTGYVNGLCSDLNPGGFVAAPGTFTYDVGTQIYAAGFSNGVWNTFFDSYMSDNTYRYTTNGSGLLISKELCSSITTTTTTTTTIAPSDNFIATETNDELITEDGNNLIMNYPLPTSEIITEDGNFVITENGDNLTT